MYRTTSRQQYKTSNSLHVTIRKLHPPSRYIFLTLSLLLIGWIGSWSQAIKRGNAHYEAGAYDAALEAYQSATTDRPEDAVSHYNLGTALYQKKQFEAAADEFRRSLDVTDPIYRAQGYYNLGNVQIQLNDIAGAIRSYKSALRLNPTDLDAKHNLELALEKLEQKPQQNQSESGEGDKDQQEQEQQQQSQQNSNEQQSNQQNQENPAASEGQNQGSSEQESTSEESASQLEQESAQHPVEMSKEDAIRLLDAVKDDEKEIQKKILQKRFSRRQRPEKDW